MENLQKKYKLYKDGSFVLDYSGRIPEFMATFLTAFASAFTATAPFCLGLRHTASNFVSTNLPANRFLFKEMDPGRLKTNLGHAT
jgi:hypothetical protein